MVIQMGTNNNILQIIKVRAKKSKKNSVKKISLKFLYAYFLPENLGNGNSNGGQCNILRIFKVKFKIFRKYIDKQNYFDILKLDYA